MIKIKMRPQLGQMSNSTFIADKSKNNTLSLHGRGIVPDDPTSRDESQNVVTPVR